MEQSAITYPEASATPCLPYEHFTGSKCENGRWLVLKRVENESIHYKKVFISCGTYSCPVCRIKKNRKFYKLISKHCPKKDFHMLTLTLIANNEPLAKNWRELNKMWDILLKRLKRKYGKVKYFRVMEITKNGMPHIHALINCFMPKWLLKIIWKKISRGSYICHFEKVRDSCAGYILKYFYKAIRDIGYIRATTGKKTRIFNFSRNLLFEEKTVSGWSVVGMFDNEQSAIDLMNETKDSSKVLHGRYGAIESFYSELDIITEFNFLSVEALT